MKHQYLFIILLLVLALAGCTGSSSQQANGTTIFQSLPINITCPAPNITAGSQYSSYPITTGGSGGYTYLVDGEMPPGISFNGYYFLGVTNFRTSGDYQFTLRATDSIGNSAEKQCHMTVKLEYYLCDYSGKMFYTRNQCLDACANNEDDCDLLKEKKKTNILQILAGLGFLFIVLVASVLHFFRDEIATFFSPEHDRRRQFAWPVLFPKTGLTYRIAENIERDPEDGHMSYTIMEKSRRGDRWRVSSKTHALSLDSLWRWNSQPKIIEFSSELKRAYADLDAAQGEISALRERYRDKVMTDILGFAKEESYFFKAIGENVHSVNVQPMHRTGSGYSGNFPPPEQGWGQ